MAVWLFRVSFIFFVRYRLLPIYLTVAFVICNYDVRHSAFGRRAVPVFDVGIAKDDIAFVERSNSSPFFLIKPKRGRAI
jgi:hypothetical protein